MDVGYQICIKLLHINKTLIHSNIDSIMVFKEKHMCSWGWQRLSRASQIQMCSSGITSQIPNTYVFFQKTDLPENVLVFPFHLFFYSHLFWQRKVSSHPSWILLWCPSLGWKYSEVPNRKQITCFKYWDPETYYDKVMVQDSLSVLILYAFGLRQSLSWGTEYSWVKEIGVPKYYRMGQHIFFNKLAFLL